jgi:hypothetical protein
MGEEPPYGSSEVPLLLLQALCPFGLTKTAQRPIRTFYQPLEVSGMLSLHLGEVGISGQPARARSTGR